MSALSRPIEQLESFGEVARFWGKIVVKIINGRVFKFIGEAIRQAGILITGSGLIVLGLCFILGLQCGIEGAYGVKSIGAASATGAITAICDLREITPYAFGYMLAAKVGTGFVAELGSMRISDEIDALEVMGFDAILYLGSTRLLATWIVVPFLYAAAIAVGYFASYMATVVQLQEVSKGGYLQLFWEFQSVPDFFFSFIKAIVMATFIVLVCIYYGYNVRGGPVGVGKATAQSMVANILGIHVIGMVGTQLFWGTNGNAPIGG
ncbi:MAG: ABC transporter permease [Solirubrobacterales bacterium]|nr:ABC transporter permease [Solirubrobacterales bacterium]